MKLTYIIPFLFFTSLSHSNADKEINMATDQWKPYYAQGMQNQGPITEITRLVLNQLDYQLNVSFVPWNRALEHTKKGNYDAILGAYSNTERDLYFWYSDAITISETILFGHQDSYKQTANLNAFEGSRICIINGYYYSDAFTGNRLFSKVKSNTLDHCFKRLIARRVDYVAADKRVGQALLNEQFSEDKALLTMLPLVISQQTLHILWSKKTADFFELNKAFNLKLQELKKSGEIEAIWKKHGF